ncbi:hypothetical protein HQ531_04280 [bacterium]|nr:hypothetical protein [bacterium]
MRNSFLTIICVMLISGIGFGQESGIGIGFSSNGISGKYWLDETNAIVAQLGTQLAASYLIHNPELLELVETPTPVYYGAGIVLGTHKDDVEDKTEIDVGINGVIGISYYLSNYPMDIFFEETPTLYIMGGKDSELFGFTLGVHYFF